MENDRVTSQDLTPESFIETARRIEAEIGKVIVGQRDIVRGVLISILAGGHVLLEGVPGLGKTLLVRTLAQALRLEASRVQFTPDLMPADITGTNLIVDEGGTRSFRFQPGPIFANLVLADEINRATPKTQSALLEAMQERRVTIARTSHVLREPFLVLATQNPIEMEGTYPLPEAQLDRFFFKLNVGFPGEDDLVEIATRTTSGETRSATPVADGEAVVAMIGMARELPIARPVTRYAARLVLNTHPTTEGAPREVKQFVRHGASPRGVQTLVLAGKIRALLEGRFNVAFEDIREVATPALRHRVIMSYEGEAEGLTTDAIVASALAATPQAQ
ncbi:MAG: AAA family ATPase [Chloroflexota bacterium]|nr:MAG: AAA family ATPase [Chloroflexota bacterium]